MAFEDVLWAQGKDNMGGLVGNVFFCPTEDIDWTTPLTLSLDGATITGTLATKSGKKFYQVYHTRETGKIDDNVIGERDGKAYENMLEFFHPGNTPQMQNFKRLVKNTPGVWIAKDTDGKFRVLGIVALGDVGSEVVSLDMPAYVDTAPGTTGAAVGDRRGTTMTVKSESPHPPLFYDGDIPLVAPL